MLSTYPALEILEAHKLAVQTLNLGKHDLNPGPRTKSLLNAGSNIKPQFSAPESSGRLPAVTIKQPVKQPATATFAAMK